MIESPFSDIPEEIIEEPDEDFDVDNILIKLKKKKKVCN